MGSILKNNGNKADGFINTNKPKDNPFEMDIKGDKEDLTWLLK